MTTLATIEIGGSPHERGLAYGAGLRALIVARDRAWREAITRGTGLAADDFLAGFLAGTDFLPEIERQTPQLLDEVRGIAEGCGLPFEAIYAAQLMDEEWWFSEMLAGRREHCSSLGSHDAAASRSMLAQTMDLPNWNDGFQVALTIRDLEPGLDAIVLTMAGMIGLNGMNSAGLGVVVNTLAQLRCNPKGLPVAFASRGVLRHRTHDAAIAFLQGVHHASGQNFIIGDRQLVSDHECSAAGAFAFVPERSRRGLVWHANHPLASKDRSARADAGALVASDENTHGRMAVLDHQLQGRKAPLGVIEAQLLLANRDNPRHPISRRLGENGSHAFTFATVVWDLGPEPVAHIAPGPACTTPFVALPLARRSALAAE